MRIALAGLYSAKYPAIGETHALSVLAAIAQEALGSRLTKLDVFDMVSLSEERVEPLLAFLIDAKPDVLGISVSYGTFSFLTAEYKRIRNAVGENCWIVLGGSIATALSEELLKQLKDALVVTGEGEIAFGALLRQRLVHGSPDCSRIPGLVYNDDSSLEQRNRRVLTDLASVPPPYRNHAPAIAGIGGQIFTEASRGCSWAACKFCLRGLTDIRGTRKEYRRFSNERLRKDLQNLFALGINHVTFADEDFLGTDIVHARRAVDALKEACGGHSKRATFDVSIMPNSVYSTEMPNAEVEERRQLVTQLSALGLRKAFLGIESGAPSQLRRYTKGHSREDASGAVITLRDLGVDVETGWIMFDPLCTRMELAQNAEFLRANDLVISASYVFSELRLQVGTRYLSELIRVEKLRKVKLFSRSFDPDTLSHTYQYLNAEIAQIVAEVSRWSKRIRSLHYPLKSLTRFEGSILNEQTLMGRSILSQLRSNLFGAFETLISPDTSLDDSAPIAWDMVEVTGARTACDVLGLVESLACDRRQQPMLAILTKAARDWRSIQYTPCANTVN